MKAICVYESRGLDSFVSADVPDPEVGPTDVLVRVRACGLNHIEAWETKKPQGVVYDRPRILGADIAGVVEAVGVAVEDVQPGTEVLLQPGVSCGHCEACLSGVDNLCPEYRVLGKDLPGGLAELVAVPGTNVVEKPSCLSFEQAAAIPVTFLTAWHALVACAGVRPGESVLVNAAGSGVGTAAVQIAKLHGAQVIASAGSDAKLERAVRELGADETINYNSTDLADETLRLTDGRGVDIVIEQNGGSTFENSTKALARRGRLVLCGATGGQQASFQIPRFFLNHLSVLGSFMGTKSELIELLRHVESGRLRPVVTQFASFDDIRCALQQLLDRSLFGKIVLRP